ncbi:gamma-glutamyltranspeptidase/glutathione hydrolase [Caldalkalibacillus uzonensis]|uniref:Glutathione hydrolase proenzyme n=1 Tax=Caldalkalibacillus uzonensis TaxID=353224 RepID=A0ABU0CQ44_9BACI|nr:gamma-glutamyltransferase [Caldalkalibacillus uzonensis]MDQ0338516.1 gamma-glutamyltranspeptidase/glutathione hydrolase [Caldalkalibacillus uzonensis]
MNNTRWLLGAVFTCSLFLAAVIGGEDVLTLFHADSDVRLERASFGTETRIQQEAGAGEKSEENKEQGGGFGVSAAHPLAVEAGMNILEQGGNAVDAAIAVSYVLGVVEPYGSGIGGGGVMLVHPADGREPQTFHYREVAPFSGNMPKQGVGIPGLVQGMEHVHQAYGSMPMDELMEPAIRLAEEGFQIDRLLAERLALYQSYLSGEDLSHFYPAGEPLKTGDTLKQPELAATLKRIRDEGAEAFYEGETAEHIAKRIRGITAADLKQYRVREGEPVQGTFGEYEVLATDSPTAGITLIQALQMAEAFDLDQLLKEQENYIHLLGEIAHQVYADRLQYIADPAFVDVPAEELISDDYVSYLVQGITKGELSSYPADQTPADQEDHQNTTHFVIVDQDGMMVSATHTLSQFFGSGVYVDGFFLNNQLKNFSENEASLNAPEAGKSPRTYITPVIITKEGKPVLGIGTPGGKRIPLMLVQVLINWLYGGQHLQQAIEQPRFYVEDQVVYVEEHMAREVISALQNRGYNINYRRMNSPFYFGGIQALYVDEGGQVHGGADSRRGGSWQATNM